jgi:hypothetical protein
LLKFLVAFTFILGAVEIISSDKSPTQISKKCNSPSNSVQTKICSEFPLLKNLSDYEAVGALREIVYSEFNFANTSVYKAYPTIEITESYTNYLGYRNEFTNLTKGGLCGAASEALATLYRDFGLPAETFNFGIPESTATHVVTLVKLNQNWYWQDATYDYELSFDAKRTNPVPIQKILANLTEDVAKSTIYVHANNFIEKNTRYVQLKNNSEPCLKRLSLSSDVEFCEKLYKKSLSELFSEKRYVDGISSITTSPDLGSDPRIFLHLVKLPIGNSSEINCLIAHQCLNFVQDLIRS